MNRREFARFIGLVAVAPFCVKPKKSPKQSVVCTNHTDPVQSWSGPEGVMDFGEEIKGVEHFQDKLLVFCERSVWEVDLDNDGYFKKQLLTGL